MEISVISFNIRCCNDLGGNSIKERAPRLHTVTAPYNADLIGFQEYRPAWEAYIAEYYGDQYDMFNKYRASKSDIESSPLLWKKDKFECIKTGYFWLSDTPETESRGWDEKYNCYRMCAYVILKCRENGKMFTFMNTHFGFGDKGQVKSADLIHDYSQKISPYPTFIVGDFNMIPSSLGYAAMTQHFTDVNAATAKDQTATFHGYSPKKHPLAHIDYCFTDKQITPISRDKIDALVNRKFPSDHYGLYMKLEI